MGSEQQYISLFEEQQALLFGNSVDIMNRRRKEAMDDFKRLGFPTRKVERYRYQDVSGAFAPNYGVNLRRIAFPVDPYKAYRCSVPNMGTALYYMVNDIFYVSPLARATVLDKVYVGSLKTYALAHPDFVEKYYGTLAPTRDDAVTALNTAFAQDGLLIYVPDGVKVDQTLQIVNLMRGDMDLLTCRRLLIVIGAEAEANILFCEHNLDKGNFLTSSVGEINVGKGARLCLYDVEETSAHNRLFENFYVRQMQDSQFEYATITLRNGLTRRRLDVTFDGEGSETRLMGAVVAAGNEFVDNNLLVDHRKGHCRSDILFKYVLDDDAVGAFAGKVLVEKNAQKTDSQETNANLCVSPRARMYTQPMLEIYADDVKCNHGSTVGQLDPSALFYMAQRGIGEDEARLLLQHAFVNEVVQRIRLEPLRERLSQMVDARFRYGRNACSDCDLCKEK